MSEGRRFYGIYRGTVSSIKDPLNKRRIKVILPAVLGESAQTEWAWPLETSGIKSPVPAVNQGVWVMFENGDPSYPIWAGTFGKVVDNSKHVLIKPTKSSSAGLTFTTFSDGVKELDLVATLIAMDARIAQLEAQMPLALQNGL